MISSTPIISLRPNFVFFHHNHSFLLRPLDFIQGAISQLLVDIFDIFFEFLVTLMNIIMFMSRLLLIEVFILMPPFLE